MSVSCISDPNRDASASATAATNLAITTTMRHWFLVLITFQPFFPVRFRTVVAPYQSL